jgi:hypothetical protein
MVAQSQSSRPQLRFLFPLHTASSTHTREYIYTRKCLLVAKRTKMSTRQLYKCEKKKYYTARPLGGQCIHLLWLLRVGFLLVIMRRVFFYLFIISSHMCVTARVYVTSCSDSQVCSWTGHNRWQGRRTSPRSFNFSQIAPLLSLIVTLGLLE